MVFRSVGGGEHGLRGEHKRVPWRTGGSESRGSDEGFKE